MLRVLIALILTTSLHAAVLVPDKRWPNGSELTVWFLDGNDFEKQLVQSTAIQWSKYANIRFQFSVEKPTISHIRISFSGLDGTRLGNHGDLHSTNPTMTLHSLAQQGLTLSYKKRIILHEFGHALGLEHEFLHPHWQYGNAWLLEQQKQCIHRLQSISSTQERTLHCAQINQAFHEDDVWWYPFDENSIMNYPVTSEWLDNRSSDIALSESISALDKIAIALGYPFRDTGNTRQVQWDNQCPQAIHLRYQFKHRSWIKIKIPALRSSEPVDLADNQVSFRAISQNGLNMWPQKSSEEKFLSYDLAHSTSHLIRIPLYCDDN